MTKTATAWVTNSVLLNFGHNKRIKFWANQTKLAFTSAKGMKSQLQIPKANFSDFTIQMHLSSFPPVTASNGWDDHVPISCLKLQFYFLSAQIMKYRFRNFGCSIDMAENRCVVNLIMYDVPYHFIWDIRLTRERTLIMANWQSVMLPSVCWLAIWTNFWVPSYQILILKPQASLWKILTKPPSSWLLLQSVCSAKKLKEN